MSKFAALLLCVQASLVQNAYSQFIGAGMRSAIPPGFSPFNYAPAIAPAFAPEIVVPVPYTEDAYGGEGIGDIAIAGRMPVAGTTAIQGQVPILGSVRFGGDVAARGTVTITGNCGCRGRYY